MPVYEWKCDVCDFKFEQVGSMKDMNRPVQCPECGNLCNRVMSSFAFPNSPKKWHSRKGVNYQTDTADIVYKKQLKIMGNKEKPKHLTNKQWQHLLGVHKVAADNTRPEKVE